MATTIKGGRLVLDFKDEPDIATTAQLKGKFYEAIKANKGKPVTMVNLKITLADSVYVMRNDIVFPHRYRDTGNGFTFDCLHDDMHLKIDIDEENVLTLIEI